MCMSEAKIAEPRKRTAAAVVSPSPSWASLLPQCCARCGCCITPCRTTACRTLCTACRFPSSYFYDGQLQDGETISAAARAAPCHGHPLLGPLVLLDCREGRERAGRAGGGAGGASLRNTAEAELVAELYMGGWLGACGSRAVCEGGEERVRKAV